MPYTDPEKRRAKQKEYSRRWYENNRKKHIATAGKNNRQRREQWLAFKAQLSCTKCGARHPAIIDFHHIVRDDTYRSVFKLAGDGRIAAAMEETKKCIPLCANCHRILHFDEATERKRRRGKKRKKKKSHRGP